MTVTVMAYGMGTNSVAMLVGLMERGEKVDLILSADTGGERPETYEHRDLMSKWCVEHGFPEIISVRKEGNGETLEENCLRMKMLPSIAYGFKGCSLKYKRAPQDKFCNNWMPAKNAWERGEKVIKLIGYDTDEERRAKIQEDEKYVYRYPLIEWGWSREDCIEAIERVGIPLPGKSACFFCPSSKESEILQLKKEHPLLFMRALNMERNASENLGTVVGLGRNKSWHMYSDEKEDQDFAKAQQARAWTTLRSIQNPGQSDLFLEAPCDCYDGN